MSGFGISSAEPLVSVTREGVNKMDLGEIVMRKELLQDCV
jgi:hypothetical protein